MNFLHVLLNIFAITTVVFLFLYQMLPQMQSENIKRFFEGELGTENNTEDDEDYWDRW